MRKLNWGFLWLSLLVIILGFSLIPFLTEWYIYFNREELLACFYPLDTPTQPPVALSCPKTAPTATSSLEMDEYGSGDETDAVAVLYATSSLTINLVNLPAEIQKIELLDGLGESHTLWKNK